MKITLITVNYRNAAATLELLRSLEQQSDQNFDVIVVDNASGGDDVRQLSEFLQGKDWKLLTNEKNLGFSGGNNVGIRRALEHGTDWLVLINNDTHVEPDFIAQLKARLPQQPGMIGIPLREGDRVAYAGRIQWLRETLPHMYSPVTQPGDFYAIGAGVAIHRSVFEKIGLLDERYFLYFEDADYSCRARKANIPIGFLEAPIITHKISSTTSALGSPLLLRYHYRNMFLFNSLHAPWQIRIILPVWAFLGIVKQFLKLIVRPTEQAESRAIMAGIRDYLVGSYGKITDQDRH